MATSAAVVYLRPRVSAAVSASRATSTVVFLPLRETSGLWSSAGAVASSNLTNLRTWLPVSQVPLGYVNGDRKLPVMIDTQTWYKFLDFFVNTFIGGSSASTLADIATATELAALRSAIAEASIAAVAQQTQANAEALAATVQVSQAAGLAGADNIPPVQQGTLLP